MPRLTQRARFARTSEALRSSLWAVPGAMIAFAFVLASATLAIDRRHHAPLPFVGRLFPAGDEGARATLASIANSVMTVSAVAFSMTIVVLQLSASQFSPRVLRGFLRDRMIQLVLGAYLATITYVLVVLRTVEGKHDHVRGFVPGLSVGLAVIFGLGCMILLVVFLHHVAHGIQASHIVRAISEETRAAIPHVYPEEIGERADAADPCPRREGAPCVVSAPATGWIEYIDEEAFGALVGVDLVRIRPRVGDYVRKGDVLLEIWPASVDGHVRGLLLEAFSFHPERTVRQDVAFGIRMLVDVALRAISPGINDPTTAVYAINTTSDVLARLACRRFPNPLRVLPSGLRVYLPRPDFAELVHLGLDEILDYGASSRAVLRAVQEALDAIRARDVAGHHAEVLAELRTRLDRELARFAREPTHTPVLP